MTALQIIAICILGIGALVAVGFTVAFAIVALKKEGVKVELEEETDEEVTEINLDEMLKRLEEESNKKTEEQEVVEEIKEEAQEEVVEVAEEVQEEPVVAVEVVEEAQKQEETIDEAPVETEEQEEVVEEAEEVVEAEVVETPVVNETEEKSAPEFDYRIRIRKIKESQEKIDSDLEKTTRAIMKYERTIRRKERNQKMLDRRAHELTNLNLLMYSVTDIKNVDAEKKARQEELTAHIAELKASIQDAENYIEANKEKHENNLKLRDYLAHEKKRYAEEVKELETLIASGKYYDDNGNVGADNN